MRFPTASTLLLTMAVSVHAWTPLQSSSQRTSNPLFYSTDSFQDIVVNGDTRRYDKDEVFSRALLRARLELEKRGDPKIPTVEEDHTELAQRKLLQTRLELEKQRQPQKKNEESTRKSTLVTPSSKEDIDPHAVRITPPPAAQSKAESSNSQSDREESKLRALLKTRLEMEQRHKKSQKQSRYELTPPLPSEQATATSSTLIQEPRLSTQTFAKATASSNPSTNEPEQRALLEARLELERKEKQNKFRKANGKYTLVKDSINLEKRPEIKGDALLPEDKMEKSGDSADGVDLDTIGTPVMEATPASTIDEEHEPPSTETRESTPQKFTVVNSEPALLHVDASASRDSSPTYFTTGVEKFADDKFKIVSKPVDTVDQPKTANQSDPTEQASRITKSTSQPQAFEEASRLTKTLWQGCSILAKEGLELLVEVKDGFSTSKVGRSDITYPQAMQKVATSMEGLAKLCWVLGEGAMESFAVTFDSSKQRKQENPKTTRAPSVAGKARTTRTVDGENGRNDDTPSAFFLD